MAGNANATLIWSVAELLRGDYKQADYGKVILPFTLLRRLDCVLAPTKQAVLREYEKVKDSGFDLLYHPRLRHSGGLTAFRPIVRMRETSRCGRPSGLQNRETS